MTSGLLNNLAQWSLGVVYSFGYSGVLVLMLLAYLNLPIPTPLILALAGFLVGEGRFSFVPVMVASTVGAVAASLAMYFLGLWIGEEGLRRLIRRLERFKLVSEADPDKASEAFERHSGMAVFVGHLIPGVGALISVLAGLTHMPILRRFTIYTVPGCAARPLPARQRPLRRGPEDTPARARPPVVRERLRERRARRGADERTGCPADRGRPVRLQDRRWSIRGLPALASDPRGPHPGL